MKNHIKLLIIIAVVCLLGCESKNDDLFLYEKDGGGHEYASEVDTDDVEHDAEKISCHIAGHVIRSGVYTLNEGSRLIDLINAAGGLSEDADGDAVNQAKFLKDGERIYIPSVDEKLSYTDNNTLSGERMIIDINSATKEELKALPAVGEKLAEAIIVYRESHEIKSFEDLLNVQGIGKKKLEGFKGMISIGGKVYE